MARLLEFAVQKKKLYSKFTGLISDLHKPLIRSNRFSPRTSPWFKLSLIVSVLLAFCYTVMCILTFSGRTQLPGKLVDGLFWLIQAITHGVITILIIHEKRFQAVTHPLSLRIYRVANFIVTARGVNELNYS
jgi:ATP-binding cassette subfamily C (CFTR/MRP) protein 2